jgi:predicted amidohydrolase YtcJ
MMKTHAVVIFLILFICACQPTDNTTPAPADRVLLNGAIYTVNPASPWVEALAITSGVVTAVGSNAEMRQFVGPGTEELDLKGRMVMPGVIDMHIHPIEGAMASLFDCSFPFTSAIDEMLEKVADCVDKAPNGDWIRGGQWPVQLMTGSKSVNAALLDSVAPDNPVFLIDSTVHNAWVNTAALERLNIDRDTIDPPGGIIFHDSDGKPTGLLADDAAYNALSTLPDYSQEQYESAVLWAVDLLNGFGITGYKEALSEAGSLNAYSSLDRSGQLNMRVATSLIWKRSWSQNDEQHRQNIEQRDSYRTAHVNPDFIKIFLDGIPPTRTAYLLEPYVATTGFDAEFRGNPLHDSATLAKDVTDFDAAGLTVKMHAVGDGAARQGLDAIEAAREANGSSGLRHEISHAGMIHPDDIDRFAELDAIPEMAPILWYPVPGLAAAQASAVGKERAEHTFPIRSLVEAGAQPAYGSDWPAVVPTPNPWPGVEAMVTRRNPYPDSPQDAKWEEQAVDLATAIRIFTLNGARALKLEDIAGSIEVGKSADLIVLDQNVFEIPASDVGNTRVITTILEGRNVYDLPQ